MQTPPKELNEFCVSRQKEIEAELADICGKLNLAVETITTLSIGDAAYVVASIRASIDQCYAGAAGIGEEKNALVARILSLAIDAGYRAAVLRQAMILVEKTSK